MNTEPSRIVACCNEVAGLTMKPCIKQRVYAMLVTVDGEEFFGANWMSAMDVEICPRVEANSVSGQDYHFCTDICHQEFHAEASAIIACYKAESSPVGSTVYVVGHTYCCDGCIAAMQAAGVKQAIVLDSGKTYTF